MSEDPWAVPPQPSSKDLIEAEVKDLILRRLSNRKEFEKVSNQGVAVELTDEMIADETMKALADHLNDPRTIERMCSNYWTLCAGAQWDAVPKGMQELWRGRFVTLLKGVLE